MFTEAGANAINETLEEIKSRHNGTGIDSMMEMLSIKPITNKQLHSTKKAVDVTCKFLNRMMFVPQDFQDEIFQTLDKKLDTAMETASLAGQPIRGM